MGTLRDAVRDHAVKSNRGNHHCEGADEAVARPQRRASTCRLSGSCSAKSSRIFFSWRRTTAYEMNGTPSAKMENAVPRWLFGK